MALQNSPISRPPVAREQVAVFGEGAQVERAQPPRQPAVYQLALLVRQVDAGDLFHQLAQGFEVFVAEDELARPGGGECVTELVGYHDEAF